MKNRGIAIVLALLLGGLGVHRFYLGKLKSGFAMMLFFWTFIPAIIALVDAIGLGLMSEEEFHRRYSK